MYSIRSHAWIPELRIDWFPAVNMVCQYSINNIHVPSGSLAMPHTSTQQSYMVMENMVHTLCMVMSMESFLMICQNPLGKQ